MATFFLHLATFWAKKLQYHNSLLTQILALPDIMWVKIYNETDILENCI